jgi:hypothetical protein
MELSIRTEYFNPKFLHINLKNRNSSFFNISYKTPTIILNNLVFETPWMDVPFGICQYDNEEDRKKDKYYLDLSFNGYQYDIELKNFYRAIENIDNYITQFLDNHTEYLGIDINQGYIYNRQIRFNKNNNKYPPTIKLKIFRQTTKITNFNGNIIDFEDNIPAGSKAQALISCRGLWTYDNSFGLSWKVEMVTIKSPTFLSEYPFLSDDENNDIGNDIIDDIINTNNTLEELDFNQLIISNNKHKTQEDNEKPQEEDEDENYFDDRLVGSDLTDDERKKLINNEEISDENLLIDVIKKNPRLTIDLILHKDDLALD